ncbi:MAG: Replication-associated recombination protein A [candidate division WS6 bacterium OLB20]|uniref:Replication-associated recombination protein A n=1 Tax=candidate division WS6 bacterium OLB20 TaxID=1617426 RepID=A0A136LZE9_9BACT|nr:MAG: Replication-associated recombination protein A [candidate division WS6 bacterium OLB20]
MSQPLAEKLRPRSLDDYAGQEHLIGKDKPLRTMLEQGKAVSMILWGPPGSGKTTLAKLIAEYVKAEFEQLSAVTSGVADLREVIKRAQERGQYHGFETILFIDEIHRFNRAQQDALLPYVEDGTITLIGATTENPGFEVNAPLISRSRVFKLDPLSDDAVRDIIKKAVKEYPAVKWDKKAIEHMVLHANGDARTALNAVELAASLTRHVTLKVAEEALQRKSIYYDKKADEHYDTISAFIKSMRGSDASATLHYLARMLKAGEDPMFIARRMVIFASEDISNAAPTALVLATTCMQAVHMIGMPEAQLILAQTATYLASAPKSIASMTGLFEAMQDLDTQRVEPVPLHLRNEKKQADEAV